MKLHEAIERCQAETTPDKLMAFRPVSWRGNGYAYAVDDGLTELLPAKGFRSSMTVKAKELAGDWEIGEFPDLIKDETR